MESEFIDVGVEIVTPKCEFCEEEGTMECVWCNHTANYYAKGDQLEYKRCFYCEYHYHYTWNGTPYHAWVHTT